MNIIIIYIDLINLIRVLFLFQYHAKLNQFHAMYIIMIQYNNLCENIHFLSLTRRSTIG